MNLFDIITVTYGFRDPNHGEDFTFRSEVSPNNKFKEDFLFFINEAQINAERKETFSNLIREYAERGILTQESFENFQALDNGSHSRYTKTENQHLSELAGFFIKYRDYHRNSAIKYVYVKEFTYEEAQLPPVEVDTRIDHMGSRFTSTIFKPKGGDAVKVTVEYDTEPAQAGCYYRYFIYVRKHKHHKFEFKLASTSATDSRYSKYITEQQLYEAYYNHWNKHNPFRLFSKGSVNSDIITEGNGLTELIATTNHKLY